MFCYFDSFFLNGPLSTWRIQDVLDSQFLLKCSNETQAIETIFLNDRYFTLDGWQNHLSDQSLQRTIIQMGLLIKADIEFYQFCFLKHDLDNVQALHSSENRLLLKLFESQLIQLQSDIIRICFVLNEFTDITHDIYNDSCEIAFI